MRLLVNWALAVGSFPVVKLLGGRGVVGCVVKLVGGVVLAVAV